MQSPCVRTIGSGDGTPVAGDIPDAKLPSLVDLDHIGSLILPYDSPASPASSDSSTVFEPLSDRVKTLLTHNLDITPVDEPLFPLPKPATVSSRDYLPWFDKPYSRRVAEWQHDFMGIDPIEKPIQYRTTPLIEPLRPNAPTLIAMFYLETASLRRPLARYFDRLRLLARLGQQTILYCSSDVAQTIREMRSDPHWIVIEDYETVWDVPSNRHQHDNFSKTYPVLFDAFVGTKQTNHYLEPTRCYLKPHLSAVYNAKAALTYDAVMRNPFGSDIFMYIDAGFLNCDVVDWASYDALFEQAIDDDKLQRAIAISRTSGVVMGEYSPQKDGSLHGYEHIDHECWTDPKLAWTLCPFVAYSFFGDALGMLNFSVRWMQTVDDLDANDYPTGREEYMLPHVAVRYPNTMFTVPQGTPTPGQPEITAGFDTIFRHAFSGVGGKHAVAAITDPIATGFCPGYIPRHRNLTIGELCECESCRSWLDRTEQPIF